MRKSMLVGFVLTVAAPAFVVVACSSQAQSAATQPAASSQRTSTSGLPALDDLYLQWPLPPGAETYGAIDGKRIHQYVVEQSAIARRYRDQGHQFWGRIIGTSSDAESAEWVLAKFKQFGLTEAHIQPIDLAPQWMPQSWEVTASAGGKTLRLESAWPATPSAGTQPAGLDLEAVFVGLGSEAEYIGRDVRGKAVFIYSPPKPGGGERSAEERAQSKGAAAIFNINGSPGNIQTLLGLTSSAQPSRIINVPMFSVGKQDGFAVRDMATASQLPRVKVRLDVKIVPDLKTATVWGTLKGTTDETIYVIAHRDGYFDSATDNASGVASMVALAEYYSKIPQAQRRRTMVFLGISGHHPPPQNPTVDWLMAHRDEVFAKTALLINAEHTSTLQTYLRGDGIRRANTYTAQLWYAGGVNRPKLQEIAVKAFKEFGVSIYAEPEAPGPPGSDLSMKNFWRYVPGVETSDYNIYFHTNEETPETVPWTGLEATTRSYARIVDEVNKLDLKEFQRPPEFPQGTASQP